MTSRSTFTLLMVGASLGAMAAPACAQDAGDTAKAASGGGLEEIVVTAQKRSENLQETPLAITAVSSKIVDRLNITNAKDLSALAPSLTVTQSTNSNLASVVSIRGIPNPASEVLGLDTSNGLYVDGVYMARAAASAIDVSDIERIEVLRGPQGTLFGRNTTGGAISFISRDPSSDFHLTAQAGAGNYAAWNGRVTLEPGSIGGVRTSFSYMHRQRNGVVDNILQPDSRDPGSYRTDAARFALRADIGGTGSIRYSFDWMRSKGRTAAFQFSAAADGTPVPPILGLASTQQAPVQQYLAEATFLQPGCAALAAPQRAYRKTVCLDDDGGAVDRLWGHNLRIENDFGGFRIKSTTGYRSWRNHIIGSDLDGLGSFTGPAFSQATLLNGMPAGLLTAILGNAGTAAYLSGQAVPTTSQSLFSTSNRRRQDQFSQEVEISGAGSHLDWVVGGYYFWEKGREDNPQNSGYVLDTDSIFLANFGEAGPALAAANPARYRMVATNSALVYDTTAESTAFYGQATFYPTGRDGPFNITAGARYTWDTKAMRRYQNGPAPLAVPETGKGRYHKLTWNFMLGYKVADGINTYARIARGYRSGGFNAPDVIPAGQTTIPSFRPETITSYEAGVKTELFDRRLRLNIAGYHNEYRDLLVTQPVVSNNGTFGTTAVNAGRVDYNGVEIEASAVVTDTVTVQGGFGYVDTKYKQYLYPDPNGGFVNVASIAKPSYSSPVTANASINYDQPLSGDLKLFARLGYTYESRKNSFPLILTSPFANLVKADPRNLIDAQIGLGGMRLGGGEAQVKFWVKNLTNAHDVARGIDFGQLGYAGVIYADPRTFGADVTIKF